MTFQTSGLNTGSVRLETLIFGFSCARAAGTDTPKAASTSAKASAVKRRRCVLNIEWFLPLAVSNAVVLCAFGRRSPGRIAEPARFIICGPLGSRRRRWHAEFAFNKGPHSVPFRESKHLEKPLFTKTYMVNE